jgi:hypothetical protein
MLKGKRDGRSPDLDTLNAEKGKSKQKNINIKNHEKIHFKKSFKSPIKSNKP